MFLIDTNVWLEHLLGQTKSDDVRHFLGKVTSNELFITDFTFHSIGLILSRLHHFETFQQFIKDTFVDAEVSLLHLKPEEIEQVLQIIKAFKLDFDDAYQYVAHRYGLNLHAIAGLSPEAEPSPQRLAKLTERIKDKKISTVFFETLTTPKLAETLARETGAKTDVLNPIEGLTESEQRAGKNYDSIMQENLVALRRALVCQ